MRDIWIIDRKPEAIKLDEIMYDWTSGARLSALAKMMGGVMTPASMASECWKPATTYGEEEDISVRMRVAATRQLLSQQRRRKQAPARPADTS